MPYPDDGSTDDDGTAGNNEGKAKLQNSETTGTYSVASSGVITVTIGSTTYTITPKMTGETAAATETTVNLSGEDGSVMFSNVVNGYYYLREVSAPDGYILNTTEVMVAVNDDSIMANAGTADDGVTMGRGPGYLVSSMNIYASEGDIDNTLTYVYGVLKTTEESTTFAQANTTSYMEESGTTWRYITENYWSGTDSTWLDRDTLLKNWGGTITMTQTSFGLGETANTAAATVYLTYDPNGDTSYDYVVNTTRANAQSNAVTNNLTGANARRLFTDVGWSYLELYQDDEYVLSMEGIVNNGDGTYTLANGASYTLLDSVVDANGNNIADGMISSLFSRSLYIQVTDEKPIDLEIDKVGSSALTTLTGAEFYLYKVTTDSENAEADEDEGTKYYYAYNEDTGEVSWVSDKSKATKLTTTGADDGDADDGDADDGDADDGDADDGDADDDNADDGDADDGDKYQTITVHSLTSGTYYLVETAAPDGYNLLTDVVEITVADGAVTIKYNNTSLDNLSPAGWAVEDTTYIKATDLTAFAENVTYYIYDEETKKYTAVASDATFDANTTYYTKKTNITYTITVPNSTGESLPHTGGTGTTMYTLSGLLLIAAAVGYGYKMRRRRERRART